MENYSACRIDKPYRHNQNLVRRFHGIFLLWSTKMKTVVKRFAVKIGKGIYQEQPRIIIGWI
ncbi:MAG: hypothetical protein MGU50_01470 [Trichodesmium sp. MAG_R02]|nr:hypothetical protein [Trichodesmium sp. MAG_R02]